MTKKEKRQYEALKTRVSDIAMGAGIEDVTEEDYWCFDAQSFSRFVGSIENIFGDQLKKDYQEGLLYRPYNLDNYDSLKSTVEFLFNLEVRAGKINVKGKEDV